MKRDMDVIRKILLALERLDALPNGYHHFSEQNQLMVEGVSWNEVYPHLELLYDAGLYKSVRSNPDWRKFRMLTWDGHDFLESVRNEDIWEQTKDGLAAAGGFTFDLAKALAKGFIKKKIETHTGVQIDI